MNENKILNIPTLKIRNKIKNDTITFSKIFQNICTIPVVSLKLAYTNCFTVKI